MTELKICSKCGEEKCRELFHNNKNTKDRKTTRCKECTSLAGKKYRDNLPAERKKEVSEYQREYAVKNRERIKSTKTEWLRTNKERASEKNRLYMRDKYKNSPKFRKKAKAYARLPAQKKKNHIRKINSRITIDDNHCIACIYSQTGLKAKEITPEMIELKRAQLELKRAIKEIENEQ